MRGVIQAVFIIVFILEFPSFLESQTVSLWEHKNKVGKRCEILVKGCVNVCDFIDDKASSIGGDAYCVQLYKDKDCKRFLRKWNSGYTSNEFTGNSHQDVISSVGDCSQPWEHDTIWFHENKDWKGNECQIKVDGCNPVCDFMERKASSVDGQPPNDCTKFYGDKDCKTLLRTWNKIAEMEISDFKGSNAQDAIMAVGKC